MKEEILALLLTAFAGVRKDGLSQLAAVLALQVKTKEEANEVIGKLTADQVNAFVNDWRKEADAEIEKANQTREANLRKKYDFVEKKPEDGNGGNPPTPPAGNLGHESRTKYDNGSCKGRYTGLTVRSGRLERFRYNRQPQGDARKGAFRCPRKL